MKILIAEDERITRRSLQRQLESWGHDVVAAADGREAWEEYQRRQFDIVVTDWEMPRMDGRELIQCIRGGNPSSYTYLIMLTGHSETADLIVGMEAGADDFLAKPFDRGELRVRLHAGERIIQLERKLAARNKELSKANARMKRDLEAAAGVQRDLLPTKLPDNLGAGFAWHFEPCDELGGDILNVLPLDGRNVAMYLLDVAGHGVPAALLSVTLSRVLTTRDPGSSILVTQGEGADIHVVTPPHEVAERLNRQFPMEAQGGRFFTMAYAVLDTEARLLRYANAGHPPPILVRQDCSPQRLSGCGLPIGVLDEE
jgi:sigma-B regulation protein RsbU (phosphoserine phosphatase)